MANADAVESFLRKNGSTWCDDCIKSRTGISTRQQVNQICRILEQKNVLSRYQGRCVGCGRHKIVSSIFGPPGSELADSYGKTAESTTGTGNSIETAPWYWEGNIQAILVSHLAQKGYKIMSVASTSSRISGKDIEAVAPDGKRLWVSVKGWPEKSQNTQARHWFAGALMDIILYREESKDVELALAFPDGFPTYLNLARRINWFKDTANVKLFFVSENGVVREE